MARDFASRLLTPLPKLGIRPAIDGRYGGVRESLEPVTLAMARAAATLIEANVRHACGLPVECVVPERCIGGFAEVAAVDAEFARAGVGASLTVTPCWCYGGETIDAEPTRPKAIWGFNGTDRPGAVYLAAALAAHSQDGSPCFGVYGRDVQDLGDEEIPPDVREKLLRFARVAIAAASMRGTAYLAMGGTSMGIAGSRVDAGFFRRFLGMRVESVDMSEFAGRIARGVFDPAEFERGMAWAKANCPEGRDVNASPRSRAQKDADWETCVKMALIARDLMVGNPRLAELGYPEQARGRNAIAGGFQGQRQWTDHFPNGDFLEAVLCSSFDWDGVRQPYVVATENDSLNGASMLFGHLLTGAAQLFCDVRTYWSPAAVARATGGARLPEAAREGFLHLINSGPAALDWTGAAGDRVAPHWELEAGDARACLAATRWCASDLGYFPGGGWSTDFVTRGGIDCTMFRLNLTDGLGPTLQLAEGSTLELPEAVHDALDARTSPTWPSTWFVPRLTGSGPFASVYDVMRQWGANHGAVAPGHIGADLVSLAAALRIPVDMHNLDAGALYRPSAWDRFGTLEPQGADFRACAAFGPLYG